MRKTTLRLILGISCTSLILGWLVLPFNLATANPGPDQPDPEKPDFSRYKPGYIISSESANPNTMQTANGTDNFGYDLTLSAPNWKDARKSNGGTLIPFSNNADDEYSDPIDIGFTFPFYENNYSELYVSTNGIITFGEANDDFENREIPRDTLPNNFIAPLWDDLLFVIDPISKDPISRAFYKRGTEDSKNFFVVEWFQVARLESDSDILTFEVILWDNGDIWFQYQQLSGTIDQATVGIEDDQGVDGNIYLFNHSGLTTSEAIHFNYPPPSARGKIYPKNQGSFITNNYTNIEFTIRNTGDLGKDTFDLTLSAVKPGWTVTFYDDAGSPLKDTNSNGKFDTGSLNQDAEKVISVHVNAPKTADVGEYIHATLTATSSKNTNKKATATLDVAVPSAFAQALQNGDTMRLNLVWRENQISVLSSYEEFTGSNLTVQRLNNGNYFYSWEHNGIISNPDLIIYSDLRYTILSDLGGKLLTEKSLTDNSEVAIRTEDRFLASSVTTSSNLIGIIWVHTKYDNNKSNQNIFFTILDNHGNTVVPAKNLTHNTAWRGSEASDAPYFVSPRIETTDNDRFVIAWTRDVLKNDGKKSDIEIVVYNTSGNPVKTKTLLTNSQPDGIYYITPMIEKMSQNRVLVSYSKNDPNLKTKKLVYQILNSDGSTNKVQTAIANSDGATTHDSIRFEGVVLLAWHSETGEVGFTLLRDTDGAVVKATQTMISPNLREAASVSVARDEQGRGVITWIDRNQSQHVYYALVSKSGTKLTPEMIYLTAEGSDTVNTNSYGYGLAAYEGTWQTQLPLLAR